MVTIIVVICGGMWFFVNDTATTEIYRCLHTLSLHDALPICRGRCRQAGGRRGLGPGRQPGRRSARDGKSHGRYRPRSEEHTSEPQSLMRTSYAVFCLQKKNIIALRSAHF